MATYYEILCINEKASTEEIKQAYRKMAQKYHPDKGGDHEKFIQIKEAYDILSNPELRKQYDLELFHSRNTDSKNTQKIIDAFENLKKTYMELMDGVINEITPKSQFIYYTAVSKVTFSNVLTYVYSHLISGDFTPENIVEESKIISIQKYYIPTYYFHGDYSADWSAEFGYSRVERYPVSQYRDGRTETVWRERIVYDWYPRFGKVNDSFGFCFSGIDKSLHLSKVIDFFSKDFQYEIRKDEIPDEEIYANSFASSRMFEVNGKSFLKNIVSEQVYACAQGDDQRSWDFSYSAKVRQKTMLFPVFKCIFEYENKQYEVCINGTAPEVRSGDPLPINENQKNEANYGFIVLILSLVSSGFLINFFGFSFLIFANVMISLASAFLRRKFLIQASKELRLNKLKIILHQAKQDDVIKSQNKKNIIHYGFLILPIVFLMFTIFTSIPSASNSDNSSQQQTASVHTDTSTQDSSQPVTQSNSNDQGQHDYPKDVEQLTVLANQGDVDAQNKLGGMYVNGNGVPQDYNQALDWYTKAANQGNSLAQYALGRMYFYGYGIPQNHARALDLLTKSTDQGNAKAQYVLGIMYLNGNDVQQNYEQALDLLTKSANKGESTAQYSLGAMYLNGNGVQQDYNQAFDWFTKSADQGNADAQYALGIMYFNGNGVQQDYDQALDWYTKSANQGNSLAQGAIGFMYLNGNGVKKDYTKALDLLTKSANQGDSPAQGVLGLMYLNGNGVKKDYTIAFGWLTKSANQGNKNAQYSLGLMYFNGNGTKRNYAKAFNLFNKSANQGNADAQYSLGLMYFNGNGVKKDYTKALDLLTKSADQGNAKAQYVLGSMYFFGDGVEQDYSQALDWYTKSANQGNADAQYAIGFMYFNGSGVQQDYNQAFDWYTKSANHGNTKSQIAVGAMYLEGDGVSQNIDLGCSFLSKAANSGGTIPPDLQSKCDN